MPPKKSGTTRATIPQKSKVPTAAAARASKTQPPIKIEGKDFRADFSHVLKSVPQHDETYYHASAYGAGDAPVPSLYVEGLGDVDVPLNKKDAEAIMLSAAQAPFGKGEKTLVDTTVRHTWEINASKVKFQNPNWTPWLENKVMTSVWKSLDVAPFKEKPRLELYKMLLYEPGSHFLPHQDTPKAKGMFATVVVILPCEFEGGEVVLTHASQTATIGNRAKGSTQILAWYTDVTHQIKPVTSGYRLALSYNLIQKAAPLPYPKLPDTTKAAAAFKAVFKRLADGKYPKELARSTPVVNYILDHQYSTDNLSKGMACLKGADAHRLSYMVPTLHKLGFNVRLCNLKYTQVGMSETSHTMETIWEKHFVLQNVYTETGEVDADYMIPVEGQSIVPLKPFEGVRPDDREWEHFTGNDGGDMKYWYRRTVLMIFHEDDRSFVEFLMDGGLDVQPVPKSDPSQKNRSLALNIARLFNSRSKVGNSRLELDRTEVAEGLLMYALKSDDLELWKDVFDQVLKELVFDIEDHDHKTISLALEHFGFDPLKTQLAQYVQSMRMYQYAQEAIDVISKIVDSDGAHEAKATTWAKSQEAKYLATYDHGRVIDVESIVRGVTRLGIDKLDASPLFTGPIKANNTGAFKFWLSLARTLYENKDKINPPQQGGAMVIDDAGVSTTPSPVQATIRRCLNLAFWVHNPERKPGYTAPIQKSYSKDDDSGEDTKSVISQQSIESQEPDWITPGQEYDRGSYSAPLKLTACLLEACVKTENGPLVHEFLPPLSFSGAASTVESHKAIESQYVPLLVEHLNAIAKKDGLRLVDAPYDGITREIARLYFTHLLAGKETIVAQPSFGKLSCTPGESYPPPCKDRTCEKLDEAVVGLKDKWEFREPQHVRAHLAFLLKYKTELVKCETVKKGKKSVLVITKTPETLEYEKWETRVVRTRKFMEDVGTMEEWKELFGEEYQAVDLMGSRRIHIPHLRPLLLPLPLRLKLEALSVSVRCNEACT